MNSTPLPTEKKIPIEITLSVTVKTTAAGEMNALGFKREIDNAIDLRKTVGDVLQVQDATIEGTVKIGKQKFKL